MAESIGDLQVLATALDAGDAGRVQRALDHGGTSLLAWRDEKTSQTLLHLVASAARDRWDMHALVDQLLRIGGDVTARDFLGWIPLHSAAASGSAAAATALLNAGADVHARGTLGATPLEVASGEDVRAVLLSAGAELPGSRGSSRTSSIRGSRGSREHPPILGSQAAGQVGLPAAGLQGGGSVRSASGGRGSTSREQPGGLHGLQGDLANLELGNRGEEGRALASSPPPPPQPTPPRPNSSRHAQRLRAMVSEGSPPDDPPDVS